jgi:hypothetical protein
VASFRVELHPSASAESQAVHLWYRERSAIVADAFTAELDRRLHAVRTALSLAGTIIYLRQILGA